MICGRAKWANSSPTHTCNTSTNARHAYESLACSLPPCQLHWSNNAAFRVGTTTCHRRSHATETHARLQQERGHTATPHIIMSASSPSTHHILCARWKVRAVVFRIEISEYIKRVNSKKERENKKMEGQAESHTHPSHSQTSRLLTSSLSLGVPVPRPTQCARRVNLLVCSLPLHRHSYIGFNNFLSIDSL
jgi:hypothetical protein